MIVHGFAGHDLTPAHTGASQRLAGLYRGLAIRHETHVLAVVPNRHPGPRSLEVDGIHLVRHKAWYTSVAWRLEEAGVAPLFLAMYGHRAAAAHLRAQLPGHPAVVMADIGVAGVLEHVPGALRVYHAHNVEADHFRSAGPRLLARDAWAARLESLERRACAVADRVVVTGPEDAARMTELYGVPVERLILAPNGYDERALRPASAEARAAARVGLGIADGERVALFLGSDVPHNRAALEALLARVMPATRGVRLLVVGSVGRAIGGRAAPWLTVVPETAELAPLLAAADLGLNPVVAGGGSNVKLPAYLAAGLAVLSTPHGLRGYADLAPWVDVVPLEDMAAALERAERGWAQRGAGAPAPLAAYAWGAIGARLGDALEAALTRVPADGVRAVPAAGAPRDRIAGGSRA